MKSLRLCASFMLLGTLTMGFAGDMVVENVSVDAQISAIENATPEERVVLVNAFKKTLSTLSSEERATAIATFRSTMQANGEQLQTNQKVRVNQMGQSGSIQRTEMMNQHQTFNRGAGGSVQNAHKGIR
jgi:tRNA A37 N6-isopentenylltransferase MiaA